MRLPQFSFYQPTTVDEAVEVLKEKAGARLLSGGTDLLVNMKHRVELPHALVSLRRIAGLRGITRDGGATVIGALTTLKEVRTALSFRRSIRRWWRRHAQWALTDIRPWGRWEEMCVRTPAAVSSIRPGIGGRRAVFATRREARTAM